MGRLLVVVILAAVTLIWLAQHGELVIPLLGVLVLVLGLLRYLLSRGSS